MVAGRWVSRDGAQLKDLEHDRDLDNNNVDRAFVSLAPLVTRGGDRSRLARPRAALTCDLDLRHPCRSVTRLRCQRCTPLSVDRYRRAAPQPAARSPRLPQSSLRLPSR